MTGRIPMKNAYAYGYFTAGTGRARGHRRTLAERIRLWRRRRREDDLSGLKGWIA